MRAYFPANSTVKLRKILLLTEENKKTTALVNPVICPPLSAIMKDLRIPPELKGLKLADPLHTLENLEIDIIIGNDYYSQLITSNG